ncbi:hypothetical protein HD806DRAFT_474750 [Xylariaceae sp. AK1471]|nr:hypothetical protein HD806DRAFT_474750 [Xylariaceae sp. AK1471]
MMEAKTKVKSLPFCAHAGEQRLPQFQHEARISVRYDLALYVIFAELKHCSQDFCSRYSRGSEVSIF